MLLEFLEYDRSIVLGALGDAAGSRASYRRYVRLVKGGAVDAMQPSRSEAPGATVKRPLEPHFLKRADRHIREHLHAPLATGALALHCGISLRTLEKAFNDYRGVTPVEYIRNVRLDHARDAMTSGVANVAEVAARYGFRSPTTFANEYRKRFGVPPSRSRRHREDLA